MCCGSVRIVAFEVGAINTILFSLATVETAGASAEVSVPTRKSTPSLMINSRETRTASSALALLSRGSNSSWRPSTPPWALISGQRADQKINPVLDDQFARDAHRLVGARLAVARQQFQLAAEHPALGIDLGDGQLGALEHRRAVNRGRSGERYRKADLDRLGGARAQRQQRRHRTGGRKKTRRKHREGSSLKREDLFFACVMGRAAGHCQEPWVTQPSAAASSPRHEAALRRPAPASPRAPDNRPRHCPAAAGPPGPPPAPARLPAQTRSRRRTACGPAGSPAPTRLAPSPPAAGTRPDRARHRSRPPRLSSPRRPRRLGFATNRRDRPVWAVPAAAGRYRRQAPARPPKTARNRAALSTPSN